VRLFAGYFSAVLFAALAVFAGTPAASSRAAIAYGACGESNEYACAKLAVPLDPSGVVPGTITLSIHRRRAPVGEASTAVIALAGGPGQAAIPFAETFTEALGPILDTRDLIIFDQRGTGRSHPLSCHGFEQPGSYRSAGALIADCAEQIGPERAFYTTPDSVADIEAIRRAGGYEKLVLWGTSYGTKVAEEYAQRYPEHVEALVLDSVVPLAGPEPLERPTFEAVPRILRQLCAYRDCAHITPDPVGDLARVVRRMGGSTLSGRLIDGHGKPHTVHVSSAELFDILLAGDFNPILRAEFPAALRDAAAHRDNAPLVRLLGRAATRGAEEGEGIDVPLFLTTTCEEEAFPWSRAASPRQRIAEAAARIAALPAGAAAPFTPANMLDLGDLSFCAFWPFATAAPPLVPETMPAVPTLILSGADDLRTPTANALALAAQIPGSRLVVVPNTGHSVLETDPTPCAHDALRALFAGSVAGISPPGAPVEAGGPEEGGPGGSGGSKEGGGLAQACRAGPPPALDRPTPLPPERLAEVPPAHGYPGRTGRTLRAVKLTLADFARRFVLQLLETLGGAGKPGGAGGLSGIVSSLDSGGLRAGWVQFTKEELRFHGYSYIPGMTISGTVKGEKIALVIGGSAAAHGTLRLGAHKALVGELGGRRVRLAPDPVAHAAIVGPDAQTSPDLGPDGAAVRAAVRAALRRFPGLLGRLPGQ
jgi:pimeloyl-ACP methyl ester carboxylesterase